MGVSLPEKPDPTGLPSSKEVRTVVSGKPLTTPGRWAGRYGVEAAMVVLLHAYGSTKNWKFVLTKSVTLGGPT
jgi:hypothetical protein